MASSRDEEAINNFMAIAGLPRPNAKRWLLAHQNDVSKAANAYIDNPSPLPPQESSTAWTESDFHSDKTAPAHQSTNQPSFSIHPPDTLNEDVFRGGTGAPSRPSSPISNGGGPTSTKQDLGQHRSGSESENEQLHKVMALSMDGNQAYANQEMGVLDSAKSSLVPAKSSYYNPQDWAMTTSAQEILLNPEPADRRRQAGTPAFFKPSATGNRLPALLKIYHEIPMAREALLNIDLTMEDYGRESEWWDGTPVKVLRVVNIDREGREAHRDDVIYESQRLMAFLDKTERAYGSTEVLSELDGIAPYDNDKAARFLKAWVASTKRNAPEASLAMTFTSSGTKQSVHELSECTRTEFQSLDVRVEDEFSNQGFSIYEAIDELLWGNEAAEDQDVHLDAVGDILTFQVSNVSQSQSGLGIHVLPIIYLDRYLPSAKSEAKDMRARKAAVLSEVENVSATHAKLKGISKSIEDAPIDSSTLLATAMTFYEQKISYQQEAAKYGLKSASSRGADVSLQPERAMEELKYLSERVADKLKTLEAAREGAREKLNEISQLYTRAAPNANSPPVHRYTLRGVSTHTHTVYVLETIKPEADISAANRESIHWQWWKLEYVGNDTNPIVTSMVTEEVVLRAAETESHDAVLVYASDRAVTHTSSDLPPPLCNFVRADNLAFATEIERSTKQSTPPAKRKAIDEDISMGEQMPSDKDRSNELASDPPGYWDAMHSSPPTGNRDGNVDNRYDDAMPRAAQAVGHNQSDNGQEMQERGGGRSLLGMQGAGDGYRSGSHMPNLDMVDEDEGERGLKGG